MTDSRGVADHQRQILVELQKWLLAAAAQETNAPGASLSLDLRKALQPLLNAEEDLRASTLPQRLLKNWQAFSANFDRKAQSAGYAGVQQQLNLVHETAHLVLKYQALSRSFRQELDEHKESALYQLAYGLSHELNNPLAIISAQASALAARESEDCKRQQLDGIVLSAARGAEMIKDLMLVAQPASLDLRAESLLPILHELIEDARQWAHQFDVAIDLDFTLDARLQLDRSAFREAMWALIRNAIEANASVVTVRGEQVDDWLQLTVEDDGPGLSSEALKHCFDVYYSGREAGRGLGLGLAKARRIFSCHGGRLTLANRPARGCEARVELPLNVD